MVSITEAAQHFSTTSKCVTPPTLRHWKCSCPSSSYMLETMDVNTTVMVTPLIPGRFTHFVHRAVQLRTC